MTTATVSLVTGANGHLGNNIVRFLLSKGLEVRASVRDLRKHKYLSALGCEVVEADNTDKASMARALQGVDTFYAVGAAFTLWAKDPVREIYDVNLQGTRNLIEAAAEAGVRRIVYISSIAALDYNQIPARESNGYNPDRRDWYYNSKNDAEILAFELAKKYPIELISVLPSALIGSESGPELNVSYNILRLILNKEIPVETGIRLNWIDVKDVAEGCWLAAIKGRPGERYILANEKSMSIRETTAIAAAQFPALNIKLPARVPKAILYTVAWFMELGGRISKKAPLLSVKDIAMFSGLLQDFDTSKARAELGFSPTPRETAVKDALDYLMADPEKFAIRQTK